MVKITSSNFTLSIQSNLKRWMGYYLVCADSDLFRCDMGSLDWSNKISTKENNFLYQAKVDLDYTKMLDNSFPVLYGQRSLTISLKPMNYN